MDLTQLANLGEFIGGVAVLVTLVYLAVQVRQSAQLSKATLGFESVREFNQMHETALANTEVLSVLMKVEGGDGLTPLEDRIFRSYGARLINTWDAIGLAHQEGALSDFLANQMKQDVVETSRRYPPLAAMVSGRLDRMPDLRALAVYQDFLAASEEA